MSEHQLPEGYKQTEFGVIPEDWEVRSCSELSERIVVGIVIRPTQYYVPLGVRAFRSANIREKGISDSDLVFISETSNALLAKSQTRIGDILTVRTGYPGTSAVVRSKHAGCNCIDILITRPSKQVDSDYLAIWINSSFGKDQVLRNQGGLAQKHFNVGDMRNLVVALPSLLEQCAIAQALSDVDALISSLDKLIAKKRHLKIATMQQLLTGKKRLPGFGKGEWVKKQQKEVCSYINGRAYQRVEWETYGTPVVRLQNLTGSGDEYYYSNLILPEHQYMNYGDLIFMWSASFGPYIWKGRKSIYHYHIWKINCDPEKVDKTFYYYKLLELTENIKQGSNGSTMAHVTKREMENFSITLPEDTEEQRAIATVLSDMDTEIAALETRRAKTQDIKQGMMQELLTGKTRLV